MVTFADAEDLTEGLRSGVYEVDNGGDSGVGTLRWAIDQANQHSGEHDEILINADVTQINITGDYGPLPAIEHGVYIDYLGIGRDGTGRVVVNYSAASPAQGVNGLVIDIGRTSSDVEIAGLHIRNFTGAGILVADDLDDLHIANCTIENNGHWTYADDEGGVRIAAGVQADYVGIGDSVIIGTVGGHGIAMAGNTDLMVADSYIGTDADASGNLGNGKSGIYCAGTGSLTVRDSTICGNAVDGIQVDGPGNTDLLIQILRNNIGVAVDQSQQVVVIPNYSAGIELIDCDGMVTAEDNDNVRVNLLGNTISNNWYYGILLDHCRYLKIGTDPTTQRHTVVSDTGYQLDDQVEGGYGIQIVDEMPSDATIAQTEYVKIDHCTIADNHDEAFQINTSYYVVPVNHITITDNTISGNGAEAVCLLGYNIAYVNVIGNTLVDNSVRRYYPGAIATWNTIYSNHCTFSQNDYTVLEGKYPIDFHYSRPSSNEYIVPPVIDGENISFGYDEIAGENVWTIPFTADQTQAVFANEEFLFEVYASNVHFEYDEITHSWTYGAGDYVYLGGDYVDGDCHLNGLQGSFTAKVPASDLPLGFTSFLITATCVDEDRNDTSMFSDPVETPPQVIGVKVSNGTEQYDIPASWDSGAQLYCVPFRPAGGYDGPPEITEIQVTFSQDVDVESGDLTLVDANDEYTSFSPTDFDYAVQDGAGVATWTFDPIMWKQLALTISDDVTGAEGLALDGEWTNPTGFGDETGNSEFPSGDGVEGTAFVFFFTVPSAADFDLDGKVDDADATILAAHWLEQVPVWGPGDATGNGFVNDADAAVLAANWGTDFTTWPLGEDRAGGSNESIRRDLQLALDALFERYDLNTPDETPAVESGDAYWDGFFDDLFGIFTELAA